MNIKKPSPSSMQFDLSSSLIALALLAPLGLMLLPSSEAARQKADEHEFLGPEQCSNCHGDEQIVWGRSSHFGTSDILGKDEAYDIADALDFDLDDEEGAAYCQRCHASFPKGADEPIGVSCESCHGPASDWMSLHNETKKENGKPLKIDGKPVYLDRDARIAAAAAQGMIDTGNLYALVSNCLGCHTVPDENLVNTGGHNAGTADFELLSFSQGEVRHHFLGGAQNDEASPERKSLLFVVGKLADLEVSLRNLSGAGEGDFAAAMIERVEKIKPELAMIASKTSFEKPAFEALVAALGGLELAPGAGKELSGQAGLLAAKVAADCNGIAGLTLPTTVRGDVYTK